MWLMYARELFMVSRWMPSSRFMAVSARDVDAAERLHSWLEDDPVFEDVVYRPHWVPISPWLQGDDPESKWLNEIGGLVRDDTKVLLFIIQRRLLNIVVLA